MDAMVEAAVNLANGRDRIAKGFKQRNEVRDSFRQQLERALFGSLAAPPDETKLDLLWNVCWREHHSEGFSAVAQAYEELSELVL